MFFEKFRKLRIFGISRKSWVRENLGKNFRRQGFLGSGQVGDSHLTISESHSPVGGAELIQDTRLVLVTQGREVGIKHHLKFEKIDRRLSHDGVGGGTFTGDDSHTFENCVPPGIYEFTISDSGSDGLGDNGKGGYYIAANGITLGVSSFFFHEEKMTFELPFDDAEIKEEEYSNSGGNAKNDSACTDDFYLAIKTDGNPEETSWNVIDNDTGNQVLAGGPYSLKWAVYSHRACLPNGNYTFNIVDDGGDGVDGGDDNSGEKGFFVLSKDGETVLQSDGQFGPGTSIVFVLGDGPI